MSTTGNSAQTTAIVWDAALSGFERELGQVVEAQSSPRTAAEQVARLQTSMWTASVLHRLPAPSADARKRLARLCRRLVSVAERLGKQASRLPPTRLECAVESYCLFFTWAVRMASCVAMHEDAAEQLVSALAGLLLSHGRTALVSATTGGNAAYIPPLLMLGRQCEALEGALNWLQSRHPAALVAFGRRAGRPEVALPWLDACAAVIVQEQLAGTVEAAATSREGRAMRRTFFQFAHLSQGLLTVAGLSFALVLDQPGQSRLLDAAASCLRLARGALDLVSRKQAAGPAPADGARSSDWIGIASTAQDEAGADKALAAEGGGGGGAAAGGGSSGDGCLAELLAARAAMWSLLLVQMPYLEAGLRGLDGGKLLELLHLVGGVLQGLVSLGGAAGLPRPGVRYSADACVVRTAGLRTALALLASVADGQFAARQPQAGAQAAGRQAGQLWQVVAGAGLALLDTVPACAAAIRLEAGLPAAAAAEQQVQQHAMFSIMHAHQLVSQQDMGEPAHVRTLCRAATAALCLLPLLARQQAASTGAASWVESGASEREMPAALADMAVQLWCHAAALVDSPVKTADGAWLRLQPAAGDLWQLHCAACRLLFWCAADGRAAAALPALSRDSWQQRLFSAWQGTGATALAAGIMASESQGDPTQEAKLSRQARALAATNLQALPAAAELLGWPVSDVRLASVLLDAAMQAPLAASYPSGLLALLAPAARAFCSQQDAAARSGFWRDLFRQDNSTGTAVLLGTGALAEVLSAVEGDMPLQDHEGERQARLVLAPMGIALQVLESEGQLALALLGQPLLDAQEEPLKAGDMSRFGSPALAALNRSTVPCSEQAAARHAAAIREGLQALAASSFVDLAESLRAFPQPPLQPILRRLRQEIVPAATQLAAALLLFWMEPEQQAFARLELALCCAEGSCAYLGCSNLAGADGGAAAGVQQRQLVCSGCRVARYCGPACSHADWREGGHRRVCHTLAAEREAERRQFAARNRILRMVREPQEEDAED